MNSRILLIIIILCTCFSVFSCSNHINSSGDAGDNPVIPGLAEDSTWSEWGDFTVMLDIENESASLVQNRDANPHLDITPYLSGSNLQVRFKGWNPTTYQLELTFKITNPTSLTVSDVRLIFPDLHPDNGPQSLINASSWTTAFTGTVRPFLAYYSSAPNRIFPAYGSETKTAYLFWPPNSPFYINVKASAWLWENCQDPYEINTMNVDKKIV